MIMTKQVSPVSNMSDVQYKFCVPESDYEDNSREIIHDSKIFTADNEFFSYESPFCKHCNTSNVIKHGYNPKMLILEDGSEKHVKIQKYLCKKCNKISQTEFPDDYGVCLEFR